MEEQYDIFFAHQVFSALFSASNKLKKCSDQYLKELSVRQMMAMAAVLHAPDGKATINHIARMLGTTKQSVKQIIDIMEKKQYLATAPSERDKRAVNVTITPQGEQVNRICSQHINAFLADVFHGFTRDELQTLWALLQKLQRFDGVEPDGFESNIRHSMELQQQSQSYKEEN